MPAFLRSLLILVTTAFLFGCQTQGYKSLIEIDSVSEGPIEEGDTILLRGKGFPEGRSARVHWRGTASRVGEHEGVRVDLVQEGHVRSSAEIDATLDPALFRAIVGADQVHAAFRGDVEIGFESFEGRFDPVFGLKKGVVLEVAPPANLEREVRGEHPLGLETELDSAGERAAVRIRRVSPDSEADRAGLKEGDEILQCNGVPVSSLRDVAGASLALDVVRSNELSAPLHLDVVPAFKVRSGLDPVFLGVLLGTLLMAFLSRTEFVSTSLRKPDGRCATWSGVFLVTAFVGARALGVERFPIVAAMMVMFVAMTFRWFRAERGERAGVALRGAILLFALGAVAFRVGIANLGELSSSLQLDQALVPALCALLVVFTERELSRRSSLEVALSSWAAVLFAVPFLLRTFRGAAVYATGSTTVTATDSLFMMATLVFVWSVANFFVFSRRVQGVVACMALLFLGLGDKMSADLHVAGGIAVASFILWQLFLPLLETVRVREEKYEPSLFV